MYGGFWLVGCLHTYYPSLQYFHPLEAEGYREVMRALRLIGRDCIKKRIAMIESGEQVPNDILTQILQMACEYTITFCVHTLKFVPMPSNNIHQHAIIMCLIQNWPGNSPKFSLCPFEYMEGSEYKCMSIWYKEGTRFSIPPPPKKKKKVTTIHNVHDIVCGS